MDPDRTSAILSGITGLRAKETGSKDKVNENVRPQGLTKQPARQSGFVSAAQLNSQNGQHAAPGPSSRVAKRPAPDSAVRRASPSTATTSASATSISEVSARRIAGRRELVARAEQQPNKALINHIRDIAIVYEKGIIPDFVTGATSCVIYVEVEYHKLHPNHTFERMAKLGRDYELRVLLINLQGIESGKKQTQYNDLIKEMSVSALFNDFTTIVGNNHEECAKYISYLKSQENAAPTLIQGQVKQDYLEQLPDVVTQVGGVNRNDAFSLITSTGNVKNAINAPESNLRDISGWGPTKAKRFAKTVTDNFVPDKIY